MEKPKTYRESQLIRTCDCDMMGTWRPSAILTAMQETAGMHSHMIGCGRDDLIKNRIVWVLSRCEVRMDRYPRIGETVTTETLAKPNRRWFFPRYYTFFDGEGRQIGCASTLWVLLNIDDRKMVPPGDVAATIPDTADITPPMGMPGSVEEVTGSEQTMLRTPQYFDLDINGHVNNTRYADWACDALGVEVMQGHVLSTMRIVYDAEIRPEQEIQLRAAFDGRHYRVAGYHGDKMHFELGGELRKR